MERFNGINGETLPSSDDSSWLLIQHVLQSYRDVWVPIDAYPFLAVDVERVTAHCAEVEEFAVFGNGVMMQNIRPDEGSGRLLSALMGGGVDAGISPDSKVIVEGVANSCAHWMMYFNDPLYVGMHPFAALGTRYIYLEDNGSYQRTFGDLVIVDRHSRPRSMHVDFNPLADLVRTFHTVYINGTREEPCDSAHLENLLDVIFIENEKILVAAAQHHRNLAPLGKPTDYVAPLLTRYGRITHDTSMLPRIELSFALLHYERALREFDSVKSATQTHNIEAAFFHGVYCVVAVAACIEAIANNLVFKLMGTHPDHLDRRQPLQKINEAAGALAQSGGQDFSPLTAGQSAYDELDKVRKLRNKFMHAKESAEEIDQVALTSTVFTEVDEIHCRMYLRQLRLGVAQVYGQLPTLIPPIVTRDDVKWMGDLEVP